MFSKPQKYKRTKKYSKKTIAEKYIVNKNNCRKIYSKKTKRKTLHKKHTHKNKILGGSKIYMERLTEFMQSLNIPNELDTAYLKTTQRTINDNNDLNKNTNMNLLIKNSLPFLTEDTINDDIVIVRGGKSRVPDIIIDKYDFERAIKYLLTNLQLNTTDTSEYIEQIVDFVRKMLHTDNVVKFELVKESNGDFDTKAWKETIDLASACIKNNTKNLKNKLTNITALPYIIGDCREHGLLSSFLCNVYQNYICNKSNKDCNNNFKTLYTTAYKVDDEAKTITQIEPHVFCIMINKIKNTIWVIDPLYSDNTSVNRMTFNKTQASFIDKTEYNYYTKDEKCSKAFNNVDLPILWCGNIYINNKSKFKVINIPKIWNNNLEIITEESAGLIADQSFLNLLIYNRTMLYDEYLSTWKTHSEWCKNALP